MTARQMALTPDLLAQVHRVLADPGPDPNLVYHTEEDYNAIVQQLLVTQIGGQDLWLFAYGSLIWKPEIDHVEERIGTAHGWHRAFRLRITRWRATEDQPGLMMGLDQGGQCRGVCYRIPAAAVEENLGKLVRREMSAKPPTNVPRWIRVETGAGPVPAITFVLNRKGRVYAGKVSPEGDSQSSRRGLRSLGIMRRVSPQHGGASRRARHSRPQPLATANLGG
jgi:cation transport protein ChaC